MFTHWSFKISEMRQIIIVFMIFFLSSCVKQKTGNKKGTTTTTETSGTDPLASYAWHLSNTGQSSFSSSAGTAGQDFSIRQAHDWHAQTTVFTINI